jgi:chitin synthase
MWSPQPTDPLKLKVISCFKHINGTKLSSHLWFFEGFCRHINPQFCVLLDVGTEPDTHGIVNLVKSFRDPSVGGATGLMSVDSNFISEEETSGPENKAGCCKNFFFSVEKAQEFEYIMSHFIDKNC